MRDGLVIITFRRDFVVEAVEVNSSAVRRRKELARVMVVNESGLSWVV